VRELGLEPFSFHIKEARERKRLEKGLERRNLKRGRFWSKSEA